MLILTCPSKLQLIESMLKRSLPVALTVHGAVMHINRGNPAQHEVVVDSWPDFKVVLTRPQRQVMKDKWDYYANLYASFYRDIDAYRALLENNEAIDWSMSFQLHGHQDGMCEVVKGIAETKPAHLKPYSYLTVLHPDPSRLPQKWPRDDLHIGTINSSHVALLNDTWSEGGSSHSLQYLDSLVHDFPCTGLFNKEGQLISWSLSDPLGCLTHGYTLPQLKDDLHIGTINSSHVALLNDTWSEGGNDHSLRYLDSLVRDFPCTGLFNKECQLISWSLSDPLGCLTHGYTLPQYRGQGCIDVVTHKTVKKLYDQGFPINAGVLAENYRSLKALKRQGFNLLPGTYYTLIVKPIFDSQK